MSSAPATYQKLLEITRYITAITDPQQLFQRLVDTAVEVTGAERGYLLLLEGEVSYDRPLAGLRVAASCRIHPEEIEAQQFQASRTAILKVVTEGRASHWSDQFSTQWRSQSMELSGLRSILCEPLTIRDRTLGVLYLDSQLSAKFSEDHLELLPSFAAQAAICLENIRLIHEREEALRREHKELSRALGLQVYKETLSSFLAIASHDLKGPLTVMRTGLALLKKQRPELREDEVLDDLTRAVERATRLVVTYLDIQKIEDDSELRLDPQWADVHPLLKEEVTMALAPLRQEVKDRLQIKLSLPLESQIYADPVRLGQIAGNLIDNAIKYSPRGGEIELGLESGSNEDILRIHDQGIGMSEEGRQRLFGRFVRLEQDRSIRGTGLGLFVVRRLMEAHGGAIEVASTEGEGTTFSLHFPHPKR